MIILSHKHFDVTKSSYLCNRIAMMADTLGNLKINPDIDLDCHVVQEW